MTAGLLRLPSFPPIDSSVATIDAGPAALTNIDPAQAAAAAAMVRTRFDGTFWARPVAGRPPLNLVDRHGARPAGGLANTAALTSLAGALGAAPGEARSTTAMAIEPWSLIKTAQSVITSPNSEIALLARARGSR